jgi:hypothetical protein
MNPNPISNPDPAIVKGIVSCFVCEGLFYLRPSRQKRNSVCSLECRRERDKKKPIEKFKKNLNFDRNREIISLYQQGLLVGTISERFGLSKQTVCDIVKKDGSTKMRGSGPRRLETIPEF